MKYILLLTAIIALGNNDPRFAGNPLYDFPDSIINRKGMKLKGADVKMTDLCISGHYLESRLYEDSFPKQPSPVYLTLNNKKMSDAKKFILEEAKKYRILLINEAHHRPEHRLFTKSLLPELRAIGYEIFMAEGIKLENGLDKKTYPVSTDGYLLSEPTYGSLIRYAKKLKYEVGGYEYNTSKGWDTVKLDKYGSVKYISHEPKDSAIYIFDEKGLKTSIFTSVRERVQAENILAMIKKHPKSRVVIHVGYGHLYEDGAMMGAKLRALLQGEDVLTIDQAQWTDRVPLIDTITNKKIPRHFPFVLQDSLTKRYFNPGLPVDYIVLNKTVHDSLHRPGYLFEDIEQRMVYNIPGNMRKDCPCLFTAYYQKEYEKEKQQAIAADIIYVQDGIVSKPLLLNRGNT